MKVPKPESLEQELRETLVMLEAAGVVDPGVTAKLDDVVLSDLAGRGVVDLDRTVPTTEYSSRANRPGHRGGNELPRLSLKGSSEESSTGDFAMGELIGEGGMGLVHEAWQGALHRDVAVKTSKEDGVTSAGVQALLKEARLLARLEHPNVPPVHVLGVDKQDRAVLVMKRIRGDTWLDMLRDRLHPRWRGVRTTRQLWSIQTLIQVVRAIEYAHSKRIVHRDIKTENVMVGDFGQIYLLDWGLAAELDKDDQVIASKFSGTPAYSAPEMVHRHEPLSPLTDVYLLGATLHEILVGRPRHTGTNLGEVIRSAGRSEPYRYPESVAAELSRICNRAMARFPKDRFQSAQEFREALEAYLEQRSAVEIFETASEMLDELRTAQELGLEEEEEDKHELFHKLSVQCRFAFEQVLQLAPSFTEARDGLAACIEVQLNYAVDQANFQAARMLLGELAAHTSVEPGHLRELNIRIEEGEREQSSRRDELSTQIHYRLMEELQQANDRIELLERELGVSGTAPADPKDV